ncbi:protein translocase subunit SecD [Candidatus Gottesmanbacteria bacterium]|nr:protein translocase subunit SecD [Candidatus Gottesmanbacteria bacterium]
MKSLRLLWFIAIITIFAFITDLPQNYRFKFSIGSIKVDRLISPPILDLRLGSLILHKDFTTRYGLDLSGGTHLVLEADMKDVATVDRKDAYDSARNVIERRVNLYGLTEPIVQQAKSGDSYRIIVELPGITNINQAIDLVGKTAQLDFREEGTQSAKATEATTAAILDILSMQKTGLTGKNLKKAQVNINTQSGRPEVALEFDNEGAKIFETITGRNVGKPLGIFLDDQILSYPAPIVQSTISGGLAVISGQFSTSYAKQLAVALNAGALPVPIKVIEQRNIGATLGQESIQKSFIAGGIGLLIVGIFMIVSYGLLGLVADVALVTYALLVFSIFRIGSVTLTLAGIAGFILSIGMAVDANILIFERMKEEIRWGKDRMTALSLGFDRAFPSVRDSNISSLITCGILYWFGSGVVRGFAITLAIGILVSLFSAITVTRTFLRLIYRDNN